MKYEKWRELNTNPFDIKYKNNIKLKKIINYPPAGNDVVELSAFIDDKPQNVFIKIERSKISDFENEYKILTKLLEENKYTKIPKVYEYGIYNNKKYLVLEAVKGERLSEILDKELDTEIKEKMLERYGKELAVLHSIKLNKINKALQRTINKAPAEYNEEISKYLKYLKDNTQNIQYNTFIHGDFHYANILWNNNNISYVLDFEYSGLGFKEQDIAWSLILRPGQKFMNNISDINHFIKGYLTIGQINFTSLKWCLINGYCHFFLMNKNNQDYKKQILKLLENIYNNNLLEQ